MKYVRDRCLSCKIPILIPFYRLGRSECEKCFRENNLGLPKDDDGPSVEKLVTTNRFRSANQKAKAKSKWDWSK